MIEWLIQLLQNLFAASIYAQAVIIAWATLQCLWLTFGLVLSLRFGLWLWDWLSLAEARNQQAWYPRSEKPTLLEIANRRRSKWRGVLVSAYVVGVGVVIVFGLFIGGQPYAGLVAALGLAVLALGTLAFALWG